MKIIAECSWTNYLEQSSLNFEDLFIFTLSLVIDIINYNIVNEISYLRNNIIVDRHTVVDVL